MHTQTAAAARPPFNHAQLLARNQFKPSDEEHSFFVQERPLSDDSMTYDVLVRDAYGDVSPFLFALNEAAAESCAAAMNLAANLYR